MFGNVFRPGNFSQKWIFYDEKTEKLIFSIFKNRVRLDIKLEVRLEVRLG